jgi:hypothetical protein
MVVLEKFTKIYRRIYDFLLCFRRFWIRCSMRGNLFREEIQTCVANFSRGATSMKEKKRLEIVWETHEITRISFNQNRRATFFCQSCRSDAPHLSVAEAAVAANISEAAVFRLAEAGRIHSTETGNGSLLICAESLSSENKKR